MRHIFYLTEALVRLSGAQEKLDSAALVAFMEFERQFPALADAILGWLRTRQRASRWMMIRRATLGGKSAYELVLEGDIESLSNAIATHATSQGIFESDNWRREEKCGSDSS
jgi:hypothetical protein